MESFRVIILLSMAVSLFTPCMPCTNSWSMHRRGERLYCEDAAGETLWPLWARLTHSVELTAYDSAHMYLWHMWNCILSRCSLAGDAIGIMCDTSNAVRARTIPHLQRGKARECNQAALFARGVS